MASVGDILREKRIEQRRSIEQVAEATKIRINILQSIEANELDVLPLPYIKSFVKTYAKLLGLSEREEIKGFLAAQAQAPKVFRSTPAADAPPKPVIVTRAKHEEPGVHAVEADHPLASITVPPRSNTVVNIIVSISLVLGALVLVYYFAFEKDKPEEAAISNEGPPPTQPVEIGSQEPVATTTIPSIDSAAVEAVPEQDSLILEAKATAKVWISIVADGKRSSQMTLEIDNTYRWSADSIFTLSLGNAGGVQFTLNGKPLKSMGRTGAIVRNIRITREGVVSSSSPYTSSVIARPPATRQQTTRQQTTRPQTTTRTQTTRQRQSDAQRNRRQIPSITPAETKSPPPTVAPPEKRNPLN